MIQAISSIQLFCSIGSLQILVNLLSIHSFFYLLIVTQCLSSRFLVINDGVGIFFPKKWNWRQHLSRVDELTEYLIGQVRGSIGVCKRQPGQIFGFVKQD